MLYCEVCRKKVASSDGVSREQVFGLEEQGQILCPKCFDDEDDEPRTEDLKSIKKV